MRLFDSGKQPSRPAPKRQVPSKPQPKRTRQMATPRDTSSHVDAITLTMHMAKRDHVVHVAKGSKSHEEFAKMLQTLLKHGALMGEGRLERPAPRYSTKHGADAMGPFSAGSAIEQVAIQPDENVRAREAHAHG
jgi:hypothetical protein